MGYTYKDIDKVSSLKTWTDKQKIDELLRIDCSLYANLGVESNKTEVSHVALTSKRIYKLIKRINEPMGTLFLNAIEKK
tara:strand:- start:159 stop:395 length:237 start_codon:yes stop_codon:yes gene_type:complete